MKDEYVIINKTSILKRIKELEKRSQLGLTDEEWNDERGQEKALKQILSQSIPLIPEIEKAFDAGKDYSDDINSLKPKLDYPDKQEYISNLKLNI